jgi:hypothetical protein
VAGSERAREEESDTMASSEEGMEQMPTTIIHPSIP